MDLQNIFWSAVRARRVAMITAGKWYWRVLSEVDRRRGYPMLRARYAERFGRPLDLENPKTFTEKVQWRKAYDRRDILRQLNDKARFRGWVTERLGASEAERLFVPTLCEATRVRDIPFDRLPPAYVIKASHGSRMNVFVRGPDAPPRAEVMRRLSYFLAEEYGRRLYSHQWAYWGQKPVLIGEPLLLNTDGTAPTDVKLHMFDGRCVVIHHNSYGRTEGSATPDIASKAFLSPAWEQLDIRSKKDRPGPRPPRPERFEEMLRLAEDLSAGLDYVRIDFLVVDERPYLGEATIYPSSGLSQFEPDEADAWIGSHWVLPDLGGARAADRPKVADPE